MPYGPGREVGCRITPTRSRRKLCVRAGSMSVCACTWPHVSTCMHCTWPSHHQKRLPFIRKSFQSRIDGLRCVQSSRSWGEWMIIFQLKGSTCSPVLWRAAEVLVISITQLRANVGLSIAPLHRTNGSCCGRSFAAHVWQAPRCTQALALCSSKLLAICTELAAKLS